MHNNDSWCYWFAGWSHLSPQVLYSRYSPFFPNCSQYQTISNWLLQKKRNYIPTTWLKCCLLLCNSIRHLGLFVTAMQAGNGIWPKIITVAILIKKFEYSSRSKWEKIRAIAWAKLIEVRFSVESQFMSRKSAAIRGHRNRMPIEDLVYYFTVNPLLPQKDENRYLS